MTFGDGRQYARHWQEHQLAVVDAARLIGRVDEAGRLELRVIPNYVVGLQARALDEQPVLAGR